MPTTVTVSNSAQLYQAVAQSNGDTTIIMKAGNYGSLNLYAHQYKKIAAGTELNFVSENPNNPAVLNELKLYGANNVTFDGIKFDYIAGNRDISPFMAFRIEDGSNITVKNSSFVGDHAKGWNNFNDGYGTGTGLFARKITNLELADNTVENFYRGFVVFESKNLKITGNEIFDQSSDGMNFAQVSNVLIEDNYFHDFDAAPNTLAHMDMIQFWTGNTNAPTTDVIVRSNVFDSGSGVGTQTLVFFNEAVKHDGAGAAMFYKNIEIDNNVIRNAHKHGITVEYMDGVKITNNTVLQNADQAKDGSVLYVPYINVWENVRNATVTDNVIHGYGGKINEAANYFVQRIAATQDGYYDDLFVNALSDSKGTWVDLMHVPGGLLEARKLGSDLLNFDTTPDVQTPLLSFGAGEELKLGQYDFGLQNIYAPNGPLGLAGVAVNWDFGDGTKASGLNVHHAYSRPGTYDVVGTIKLKNGETMTASKTVEAESPVALRTDMSNRGADQSAFTNAAKIQGPVTFVNDGGSIAAKLTSNSRISYSTDKEFFNNTAFTIYAEYRKDQVTDSGQIVSFGRSSVVSISQHVVAATVFTDQGEVRLSKAYLPIQNTAWHSIAVTYSADTGIAELYFDGKVVDSVGGLKGGIQVGTPGADFVIGGASGKSFDGLIDDVAFVRGALSSAEIASIHAGKNDVSAVVSAAAGTPGDGSGGGGTGGSGNDSGGSSGGSTGGTGGAGAGGGAAPKPGVFDPADFDKVITGGGGADRLTGSSGNDYIIGKGGNDRLFGNAGDDFLSGGFGADSLFGGAGNDTMLFGQRNPIIDGGTGIDTILFQPGGYMDASKVRIDSVEIFDLVNNARDTLVTTFHQIKQSTAEDLLIRAEAGDRIIINDPYEVTKIGQFVQDGETYIRYRIGAEKWGETLAIDSDASLHVGDQIF